MVTQSEGFMRWRCPSVRLSVSFVRLSPTRTAAAGGVFAGGTDLFHDRCAIACCTAMGYGTLTISRHCVELER